MNSDVEINEINKDKFLDSIYSIKKEVINLKKSSIVDFEENLDKILEFIDGVYDECVLL